MPPAGQPLHPDAEGLLAGLDEEGRRQRLELLDWLQDRGFAPDELRRAHRRGMLLFVAAAREVGGEPRYTFEDVARLSGAELPLMTRIRRAHGLPIPEPGEAELTEVDLQAARMSQAWTEVGLTEDQMIGTTRAIGAGLSRAAEAMRAVMLEIVAEPGSTERDLAERYAAAVREVLPLLGPTVLQMLSQHLRNMIQTEVLAAGELAAGRPPGSRELSIAFADLVGFTRLGEEVPPEELGAVADRLVTLAADLVEPPVRLVKTIGDAVMLATLDTPALVGTSLDLVHAVQAAGDDVPQVRVGIAHGTVVARSGDVYGRAVNLASRVTAVARAGSVLTTREVRDAARDDFGWSAAGSRRLKGLPEPVALYRARLRPHGEGS